jgi:glucose-1-phosphate thymidylyltransferase
MNIIIPMAGSGKRLRPHTLITPKPLLPIAGKTIVARLLQDVVRIFGDRVKNVAYVIGNFGEETEKNLRLIARELGLNAHIFYQKEPLGTAHAVYCASEFLNEEEVVIAFADTLFSVSTPPVIESDGIIWVKEVENPSAYGVVTVDENNYITGLVEKPDTAVSNLAIIGVYYLKSGEAIKTEIECLFQKDIKTKGEFQLTDALAALQQKGFRLIPGRVQEWLDCGNKKALLEANRVILNQFGDQSHIAASANIENSLILPPCYIGQHTTVKNSIIGPYVGVGEYGLIENSILHDSILRDQVWVANAHLNHSLIGSNTVYQGQPRQINLGDYSAIN